jgi:hypothetical protein
MNYLPDPVRRAILHEREVLEARRRELVADIDRQLQEINAFLGDDAPLDAAVRLPMAAEEPVSATRTILNIAASMIVPGRFVTTSQIVEALHGRGFKFPETGRAPAARVTKILSGTGRYKGSKTLGWSLKGDSQAGAGLSGATELGGSK